MPITKYQVFIVGIIRTMIYEYIQKEDVFAIYASHPTTLGRPGLQWVYAQGARNCTIKWKVARTTA